MKDIKRNPGSGTSGIRGVLFGITAAVAAILLLPFMNSCQKTPADLSELLGTVPSSASVVAAVDLRGVLEKAGCKVDGASISAPAGLEGAVERQSGLDAGQKEALKLFLGGESGIDPSGAVYFVDAYDNYVTAAVADEAKFTDFVAKQTGHEFEDAGNKVRTAGNVALAGTQMWVNVGSAAIDAKAVANYSSLQASQSFAATPEGEKLLKTENDIAGWGQLKALTGAKGGFGGFSYANLLVGMMFDNASGARFTLDFLKGKLELHAMLVNDKGEPSKFLLPAGKIDTGLVEGLGAEAGMVAAADISKELVEKVGKMASSFGGSLFGNMETTLGSVDGTVALACTDPSDMAKGVSGVVETDGNPSIALTSLISQLAPVRKEEGKVFFAQGTPSGSVDVKRAAAFMKGAALAMVFVPSDMDRLPDGALDGDITGNVLKEDAQALGTFGIALRPEGKGLKLTVRVTSDKDGENILRTLLTAAE